MRKPSESKIEAVSRLEAMLREVISDPTPYCDDKRLLFALNAQGSLAKYSDIEKCIYGSSLNTLKRLADATTEGGFAALDLLRKAALSALTRKSTEESRPGRGSKAHLEAKVKDLEETVQTLKDDLLLLTLVLERSLRQSRNYADADESVRALCQKEQRELLDIITLRKIPVSAKVIQLHEV